MLSRNKIELPTNFQIGKDDRPLFVLEAGKDLFIRTPLVHNRMVSIPMLHKWTQLGAPKTFLSPIR
jgi:hypothetical protein